MKLLKPLSILLILGLISCNPNRIFENHESDFPDRRWEKNHIIEFNPNITDTGVEYRIYLALRHVYGFQFQNMIVKVTSTSPSGIKAVKNYEFQVLGENNEYLSDCSGDICDLETVIEESVKYTESGVYTYTVEHQMPVDPLPNVMEFGLIIEMHSQEKQTLD